MTVPKHNIKEQPEYGKTPTSPPPPLPLKDGKKYKTGVKFDQGKPRYELLPPDAVEAVARVMTDGASKYEDHNWTGLKISRVLAALERHMKAYQAGENYPYDSREHHLAHVIANALMAYHLHFNKSEADDRYFKHVSKNNRLEKSQKEIDENSGN